MKKSALLAMATLVALGIVPMASARADEPSDEANFVAQINALRATRGVPALDVDAGLTAKARSWAGTMAGRNAISHSSLPDGITANWQKLGENVGMGGTVDSLETAFVNSPHHYDNLVDPAFRSIGIGVVRNAAGVLFVAEEFMLTQAPVAAFARPVAAVAPAVKAPDAKALKKVVKKKLIKKVVKKKALRVKAKARKVAPKATHR
jgi:hypothetical protein